MPEPPPETPPPAWQWSERRAGACALFAGRGCGDHPEELLRWVPEPPASVSWLRQVHSDGVCPAKPGLAGEGDALVSQAPALGLAVATADCVPVLLATGESIAAVHAGWRGLEAGVLMNALKTLNADAPPTAWIGPSIGACCYEIGDDVARRLQAIAPPTAFRPGPNDRKHADLQAIARHQLELGGVQEIHSIELCTRCETGLLQSFRRDGESAGRNWAMIWRV